MLKVGAAIDIKNLRVVLTTSTLFSQTANRQLIGRLRELKDRDVKFFYIYCSNLNKHVYGHNKRKEVFRDRVTNIYEYMSPKNITG